MRVGIFVPQGWVGEFAGVSWPAAWAQLVSVAQRAETLEFESLWVNDHLQTRRTSPPSKYNVGDELFFESFAVLAALSQLTRRVRLGHLVICASYRAPSIVAKAMTTLDVMSGGRMDIGVGAGWNAAEYNAFGFRFPSLRERMGALSDFLTIIRGLTSASRDAMDFSGEFYAIHSPVVLPGTLQVPAMPLIVGGNGANTTWRLAARYADELNLDQQPPEGVAAMLPTIAARCEEIGRDPASLRVSVNVPEESIDMPGGERSATLARYAELGVHRIMVTVRGAATKVDALDEFARDAHEAGVL